MWISKEKRKEKEKNKKQKTRGEWEGGQKPKTTKIEHIPEDLAAYQNF